MNEVELIAKTKEEAISEAKKKLNASEKELIYYITEEKSKLLKTSNFHITAITISELVKKIETYLLTIIQNLGLHATILTKIVDRRIDVQIDSENNHILIGKNGQTLKALETLTKQYIFNLYHYHISLNIDIENYKEKHIKDLERLAFKTAKEVVTTQIEVSLENMNSFERRIIHNALADFKGVMTKSEGQEPNRHVIIKPV